MTSPGSPHRVTEPTALERWIREAGNPRTPVREVSAGTIELSGAVALVGVVILCLVSGRLALFWLIIAFVAPRRLLAMKRKEYDAIASALAAEVSRLPFPVDGFGAWLGRMGDLFGAIEVRLEGAGALAEAAARAAEPRARVEWPEPERMRIESDWQHDLDGLDRARRVFVEMLPRLHAEYGVTSVRCTAAVSTP